MKKILLYSMVLLAVAACSTKKHVSVALNSGNYETAINSSVSKLRANKFKKRNAEYVFMLHEAFYKANERDLRSIENLKRDGNPEFYRKIYDTYLKLDARQNKIRPLLPLQVEGKKLVFKFTDYRNDIHTAKNKLTAFLYEKGNKLLTSGNKRKIRSAYNTFKYLDKINPGYSNTRSLMEEAHLLGKDHIYVSVHNETDLIMPKGLEDELLDIDFNNQNKFWSEFYTREYEGADFDYSVELVIKDIHISPEHIKEREFERAREIVDGWKYKLDRNGNVAKDSLGNDIKIDNIIEVKCKVRESIQSKTSQIAAKVFFIDLDTKNTIDNFGITSNFLFENIFTTIDGDKRALNKEDMVYINNKMLPFPTNEQMIFDTGHDLKMQLKKIIKSYNIKS